MHEMGLMDAVVRTVTRICEEDGSVQKVKKLTLEVGEISGVEPHFLREVYPAVIEGTICEGAELAIEIVPGVFHCNICDFDFPADIQKLECPKCHRDHLTPIAGNDFIIKEIEAD